jgi:CheY-like chemotaxis protein
VDVGALAQSTEELLRRTLGEPIAVELALADGLWPCEVDPAQLENALLNLAINARDAMPGGGRLTIETGNAELDAEFARQHGDVAPGKYVMLAVHDDGQGMAPEVAARAFEPFFTTKGPGQGSGLGLSMVYGFVKQSGGHVTLDSAPGAGTTVRLYLPRVEHADVQPRRDEADHETQADPLGDGQLVLVVEDQPNVRRTVIALLRELGYRTASAGDVPQAVAAIEREPSVALVLSDVVLPGGHSGFDLMQRAQALRPGLPLLLMSGYTQDAMGADGRLRPGVTLLEKPFTQHALARALARALAAASR